MTETEITDTLTAGDHACLTFTDREERLDLVSAFVRDGLRKGQKVVCWTDSIGADELTSELKARAVRPGAAIRRGQLKVAAVATPLATDAHASGSHLADALACEVEAARRAGFPGLRVATDMCWATRPGAASDELMAFELAVTDLFADGRLCLICQYDRERFDSVTLAFAAKAHPKTLAAQVYHEHPLLRICRQYSPPGVRVAGQLDYRHAEILEQALSESIRLDRHIHLNLAGLDYIDGRCAGLIVATASRLPASRRMTITCGRAVATVLDLVGASTAPRLRVYHAHEQR